MDKIIKRYKWGHKLNENVVKSVINKLEEMNSSEDKGTKGLVVHLAKSFLPINPMNRVYEFADGDENRLCCLTKNRLCSVKEIINSARRVGLDEKYIESYDILCDNEEADDEFVKLIDEYNKLSTRNSSIYRNIRNKDYAFSSPKSSLLLSTEAIVALEEFVNSKINSGNKFYQRIMNEESNVRDDRKNTKNNRVNKSTPNNRRSNSSNNTKMDDRNNREKKKVNTNSINNNHPRNNEVKRKNTESANKKSSNNEMGYKLNQLMDKYNKR